MVRVMSVESSTLDLTMSFGAHLPCLERTISIACLSLKHVRIASPLANLAPARGLRRDMHSIASIVMACGARHVTRASE